MSLKASELRIGNLVENDNSNIIEITLETLPHLANRHWLKGHYGIPLTEEWVSKFGFQKKYDYDLVITDSLFFTMYEDESDSVYLFKNFINALDYVAKVKYVHQLQNLYFALTGEELKYEG